MSQPIKPNRGSDKERTIGRRYSSSMDTHKDIHNRHKNRRSASKSADTVRCDGYDVITATGVDLCVRSARGHFDNSATSCSSNFCSRFWQCCSVAHCGEDGDTTCTRFPRLPHGRGWEKPKKSPIASIKMPTYTLYMHVGCSRPAIRKSCAYEHAAVERRP